MVGPPLSFNAPRDAGTRRSLRPRWRTDRTVRREQEHSRRSGADHLDDARSFQQHGYPSCRGCLDAAFEIAVEGAWPTLNGVLATNLDLVPRVLEDMERCL